MNTSNSNTWIIVGAIIFAGLLIAGGIFFGDKGSTSNAGGNGGGLIATAEAVGVDGDELQSCLDSGDFQTDVEEDINDASRAGGGGTPFSVLVMADPVSQSTQDEITSLFGDSADLIQFSADGQRISIGGALPYAPMTQVIDMILEDPVSESEVETSDDIDLNPVDENDHIRGDLDAEIVLVEYSDFFCPYCGQFHDTMKQVVDTYEADEIAWVYRQFPIPQLPGHEQAPQYSQASECIAEIEGNEAFWDFADSVFANQ